METNKFVAEFERLTKIMVDKMKAKNADYARGSDPLKNLRRHGAYGIVVRMDDKICRLDSLTNPTSDGIAQVKDESVIDTAMDLATYALLLIITRNAMVNVVPARSRAWDPGRIIYRVRECFHRWINRR